MKEFSSSKKELVASLSRYTSILQQRKEVLEDLSTASAEIRSALQTDPTADIDNMIERREQGCRRYVGLRQVEDLNDDEMVEAAERAAGASNDYLGRLAQSVLFLHSESQSLVEGILNCQSECESILKTRLEATAQAIRQSAQRRKLDTAYGPATKHRSPVYLDKQQ